MQDNLAAARPSARDDSHRVSGIQSGFGSSTYIFAVCVLFCLFINPWKFLLNQFEMFITQSQIKFLKTHVVFM